MIDLKSSYEAIVLLEEEEIFQIETLIDEWIENNSLINEEDFCFGYGMTYNMINRILMTGCKFGAIIAPNFIFLE